MYFFLFLLSFSWLLKAFITNCPATFELLHTVLKKFRAHKWHINHFADVLRIWLAYIRRFDIFNNTILIDDSDFSVTKGNTDIVSSDFADFNMCYNPNLPPIQLIKQYDATFKSCHDTFKDFSFWTLSLVLRTIYYMAFNISIVLKIKSNSNTDIIALVCTWKRSAASKTSPKDACSLLLRNLVSFFCQSLYFFF